MNRARTGRLLLVIVAALGALLGFGIQPMVGRMLASSYGSAVHVWLTSLVFFQGALLLGYGYAHVVAPRLGRWHLLVLCLPLAFLPPGVSGVPSPDAPALEILRSLAATVLVPYGMVATTAVVIQLWLSRSRLDGHVDPYPLYAASNVGSLLGLLGYPLLVERWSGLSAQSWGWTAGYVLWAGLLGATWWVLRPDTHAPPPDTEPTPPPSARQMLLWLVLSALPGGLLLAATNVISSEVGSIPLVWVLPLAVYLGTWIVAFREGAEHPAGPEYLSLEIALAAVILFRLPTTSWWVAVGHLMVLGALALGAHRQLYLHRPPVAHLTTFYLWISFGGFLGGLTVNVFAPLVFTDISEYPLSALALAAVLLALTGGRSMTLLRTHHPAWTTLRALTLMAAISGAVVGVQSWSDPTEHYAHRNFYGRYRVLERTIGEEPARILAHGTTIHGAQRLAEDARDVPLSYYARTTCIGRTFDATPRPARIGSVGLGAGMAAAYPGPEDTMRFYEIDPDNERIARTWFTWLDDSKARQLDVVAGDGRLELARSNDEYDLLLMDAFSGDGIPFHLLTVEAFQTYLDRLAPDGVLLFHLSNRFFELRPVLAAIARVLGMHGRTNRLLTDPNDPLATDAVCVVFARDAAPLDRVTAGQPWVDLQEGWDTVLPWTDDYIDLWAAFDPEGTHPDGPPRPKDTPAR